MSTHVARPIKIAFMIDQVISPTAGTENQILKLISRLDRERFTPHLVVLRSSTFVKDEWRDCEVFALDVRRLISPRGLRETFRLVRWMRRQRIEIIQTFFKDADAVGIVAAAIAGVPLRLSSRRNMKYDRTPKDMLVYRALRPLVRFYLANGRPVKEHVVESEYVDAARVRVFYNLLDEDIERRAKMRASADPRPGGNQVRFVMVANLRPIKGHTFLIESVAGIRDTLPNARFVLVGGVPPGEDPSRTDAFRAVQKHGLSGLFEFAGLHSEVGEFLDAADVGILCSQSEGFSSTLLEYVAMGLPCIATRVGSAAEVVRDGYNGHLVEFGDVPAMQKAILDLYENRATRERMGRHSRMHFEEGFQPGPQIRALEQFYEEELRARRSSPRSEA